jgi:hypothetical protein
MGGHMMVAGFLLDTGISAGFSGALSFVQFSLLL